MKRNEAGVSVIASVTSVFGRFDSDGPRRIKLKKSTPRKLAKAIRPLFPPRACVIAVVWTSYLVHPTFLPFPPSPFLLPSPPPPPPLLLPAPLTPPSPSLFLFMCLYACMSFRLVLSLPFRVRNQKSGAGNRTWQPVGSHPVPTTVSRVDARFLSPPISSDLIRSNLRFASLRCIRLAAITTDFNSIHS